MKVLIIHNGNKLISDKNKEVKFHIKTEKINRITKRNAQIPLK